MTYERVRYVPLCLICHYWDCEQNTDLRLFLAAASGIPGKIKKKPPTKPNNHGLICSYGVNQLSNTIFCACMLSVREGELETKARSSMNLGKVLWTSLSSSTAFTCVPSGCAVMAQPQQAGLKAQTHKRQCNGQQILLCPKSHWKELQLKKLISKSMPILPSEFPCH